MIAGVAAIALCLVLVGSAVATRRRAGQPVGRYTLVWAAIFMVGFAVALAVDHHAG